MLLALGALGGRLAHDPVGVLERSAKRGNCEVPVELLPDCPWRPHPCLPLVLESGHIGLLQQLGAFAIVLGLGRKIRLEPPGSGASMSASSSRSKYARIW